MPGSQFCLQKKLVKFVVEYFIICEGAYGYYSILKKPIQLFTNKVQQTKVAKLLTRRLDLYCR